jgi:phospholipase C
MTYNKTLLLLFLAVIVMCGCQGLGTASPGGNNNNGNVGTPPPPPPPPPPTISSVNHIIFMMQENRSFDSYFGKIDDYRASLTPALGRDLDDLETTFTAPADDNTNVATFHFTTSCIFNTTAAWQESHGDMNRFSPNDGSPLLLNGFVHTAGLQAVNEKTADTRGIRSMGFYNQNDLISPYWFATQFATSDRWYSPSPMQTEAVRLYAMAATSQGFVHPPQESKATLTATTIFQLLDNAGVSWKIYSVDKDSTGLITSLNFFQPYGASKQDHIFPIAQFFTDMQNGTLPQFSYIEPSFITNLDEHPGRGTNIQAGAQFMNKILTAFVSSPSWKDSIFIETFDEGGGMFDHVGPMIDGQAIQELNASASGQAVGAGKYPTDATAQHVPSPDAIMPRDPHPGDPTGDFTRTGFRVPLIIVSPFAKPHYVSHTPMDYTAVLKFVETRFNLPHLTQRDAAQPDMSEFFDFTAPNLTPPTPVTQPTNLVCDPNKAAAP